MAGAVKVAWGVPGVAVHTSATDPLPVVQTGASPLPAGAATEAKQDDQITELQAIKTAVQLLDNAVAGSEFQVDVVSSALPAGAATAANQSTANTALSAIQTAVEILDNAVAGSEMQVDIVAALPAGNNNIGDVDVASLPALAAGSNLIGNVGLDPRTSGGYTTYSLLSTGTSGDATNVKGSAGQLYGWYISNTNASPAYVKFYNSSSTPTAGSGTPVLRLMIPGSTTGSGTNIDFSHGVAFSSGIGFTIVTTAPDAGSTGVAANEVIVNLLYK